MRSDCLDALDDKRRKARGYVVVDAIVLGWCFVFLIVGIWTGGSRVWMTVLTVWVLFGSSVLTLAIKRYQCRRLAYRVHQARHSVEQRRVAAPWN